MRDEGCVVKGVFGEEKGWLFGWWPPLGRPLPSPWNPLFISPWEGEGDGSRERGRLLVAGVPR